MGAGVEMAEYGLGIQKVFALDYVDAAALGGDIDMSMTVRHDVHRGTAAKAVCTVGVAYMPVEGHLGGVTLYTGNQKTIGGGCGEDAVIGDVD